MKPHQPSPPPYDRPSAARRGVTSQPLDRREPPATAFDFWDRVLLRAASSWSAVFRHLLLAVIPLGLAAAALGGALLLAGARQSAPASVALGAAAALVAPVAFATRRRQRGRRGDE